MTQDIATINSPEFINLQPNEINPRISECEIKVMYVGANRNKSYMDREAVIKMAKTLRGVPIVGHFIEAKEDFGTHENQIIIENGQIKFNKLTKPYGFVAPDARVWLQKFNEYDDNGDSIEREYLMTTGFLWTGQFPECQQIIDDGKGQSMELVRESLNGYWSNTIKPGFKFYIINDATFDRLCVLGDDVEPCYEGAAVTAPTYYTLDGEFKNTLFSMMQDLKETLLQGGNTMEDNINDVTTPAADSVVDKEPSIDPEFKKNEEEEKEEAKEAEKQEDEDKEKDDEDEEEKKPNTNHALEELTVKYEELKKEFDELTANFALLETERNELASYKESVENVKKDELISQFFMLSEDDKKEVIDNKAKLSYEEIEQKLSVICFRNKVNFTLDEEKPEEKENISFTLNVDNDESNGVPAYIQALKAARK